MKRNDLLWKAALEDLFDDFLRFIYPDASQLFDLDKGFEYLDKELEQLFPPEADHYAVKYVDKLVKVFTHAGDETCVLVHVEVQGYPDPGFAQRMFQYYCRILDKYKKPVTAFALFVDANKNFHPKHYQQEFLGTKVYYEFNTCKIIALDEAELEDSNNPFAMAVLTAKLALTRPKLDDNQLFDLEYSLAKRLLNKQMPREKIRKVMNFLRYYLSFENPQMFTNFTNEIAELTERNNTMGIEEFLLDQARKEGIEKGIEKNKIETALNMVKNGIEISLISNITGFSVEEIEKIAKLN
jgi:predicted transposase/invertase (TIGR01784 family)